MRQSRNLPLRRSQLEKVRRISRKIKKDEIYNEEENLRYGEDADETGFYNPTVDQGKLTITNTPVKNNEKVGLTITKEWVGNQYESSHRPKYITFIIIRTKLHRKS